MGQFEDEVVGELVGGLEQDGGEGLGVEEEGLGFQLLVDEFYLF